MDETPRPIRPPALGDAHSQSHQPAPPARDLGMIPLAPDDGPAPPPRPVPVRPRLPRHESAPTADRPGSRTPREAPPRRKPPRVSDEKRRCTHCGYDLRGDPRAKVCPECGATAPPPAAADALPPDPAARREQIVAMWQSLGNASMAIVVLLSPLPYFGALGFVLTSCLAFAIGFRLLALRGLEAVQEGAAAALAPAVARFRAAIGIESIAAGAFVLYALLSTIGLPIVPIGLARAILVPVCTVLAVRTLLAQLALARAFLSATGAEDTVEPRDLGRTTALLVGGAGLAIGAVAGSMVAGALGSTKVATFEAIARAIGWLVLLALLAAPIVGAIAALRMRALSTIVGEAVFECPWFRRKRRRTVDAKGREVWEDADDEEDGDEDDGDRGGPAGRDDDLPPPRAPRGPGRPGSPFVPPDDEPIPLA